MTPLTSILLYTIENGQNHFIKKHLESLDFSMHSIEHPDSNELFLFLDNFGSDIIIIIDGSINGSYSIDIIKFIRSKYSLIPIIIVDFKNHYSFRVKYLQAGADDAISLPLALEELDVRIDVLSRRTNLKLNYKNKNIIYGDDFELNTNTRKFTRAEIVTKLTIKEYDLLRYLMKYPSQVLTKNVILHNVWGESWTDSLNLLEVYVRYLRLKIERSNHKQLLQTVRGVGYMLDQ